ncbi:(2Fe-2S)-binding protein [Salibacterium aidingense]|uniref:(2Fe-2S)-binding protein n=1 Tax=Salibacterium aidingense TaxID=384933 RepID=UPI003BE5B780
MNRITDHPVLGRTEKKCIEFFLDDTKMSARSGETIAAALLANNIRTLRYHEASGSPRGIYCNIGHCFECRVEVDGKTGVRACMTEVCSGMRVYRQQQLPRPFQEGGREG